MANYNHLDSARNSLYDKTESPYSSRDPYYNQSSGYIAQPAEKHTSKWIKIGIPILILAIIGGAVGGILLSRNHKASASGGSSASAAASVGIFAAATNSFYMVPIYPSTVSMILHFLSLFWQPLLLIIVRPTLPLLQRLHSSQAPAPLEHGLQIPSNPLARVQRMYERIARVSSPQLINGQPCPNSSPPILISSTGMTPFLKMPHNTSINPLFNTSWTATVVYWIVHAKLSRESRHLGTHIVCLWTPSGPIGYIWSSR